METWREAAALVAVFGLLSAALWAMRHRAGGVRTGASKSLAAVERVALTPQHALHLVRTRNRELLIATHPQGCSLLLEQMSEGSGLSKAKSPFSEPRISEPPISEPRRENA
jgi:flagellar biogenesis protein FliO